MFSSLKPVFFFASVGALCLAETIGHAQGAPHATHGARLGGMFTAAASDTIHLEAVWSEQRRVRVFMETASGEPLPLERLREVDAVIVAGNGEFPLRLLEADGYFEARIPTLSPPAQIGVRIGVPGHPDDRVTFTFQTYSADVSGFNTASPTDIPGSLSGILAAIADDRRGAQRLIDQDELPSLSPIEERIRDRVLAIGPHLSGLSAADLRRAESAITLVVRHCWLMHMAIDYGGPEQVLAAWAEIGAALDRVEAVADRKQ